VTKDKVRSTEEALRLALEALEVANSCVDGYYIPKGKTHLPEIELAITAIKEALAQTEQEPVMEYPDYVAGIGWRNVQPPTQRPLIGLTDDEIVLIVADCASSHQHTDIHFARAIEAKLKEKNT
jgi:hypothetical protein